jgi:cysteinyl-tRNA synthetase
MKLYNTLTKQIDELRPLNPDKVTVYTCGPTVYDYAHIGHWFNYVRMDTLIRALHAAQLKTTWVMNITDVGHLVSDADEGEDKLEKGAKREGKTAWEVAEFYTDDFLECMQLLNMLTPDHIVKATDHIAEQIDLIKRLEEKGYTYIIDDGVYYDTSKFEGYAAFARLDLDNQEAGARVGFNEQKHNSSDFALWKFSPTDHQRDMEWDSPWGKGFPGWHIECSAMAMKYLGEELDIHTGGIDHVPVHHTNEIAQSEAATGKRFAQVWLHSNHVTVNGEKISKSLGNGIRLQEIIEKGIPAEAVRINILESHYRTQSKFSWEGLQAAHNRLKGLYEFAVLQFQATGDDQQNTVQEADFDTSKATIQDSLLNDLNTAAALAELNQFAEQVLLRGVSVNAQLAFVHYLTYVDDVLGTNFSKQADITDEQKSQLLERETARQNQDWATSDRLRDELASQGLAVRDTAYGATWARL